MSSYLYGILIVLDIKRIEVHHLHVYQYEVQFCCCVCVCDLL